MAAPEAYFFGIVNSMALNIPFMARNACKQIFSAGVF